MSSDQISKSPTAQRPAAAAVGHPTPSHAPATGASQVGGAIVERLDAILCRVLGWQNGALDPAAVIAAARTAAFELDLPLEELPVRASVSEPVRRALIAHLQPRPRRFLQPAASFQAIVGFVADRLRHDRGPQRILVLGCGAGEEAYSVVLALVEKGIDAEWFSVEGVDPRETAIRRARTGVYPAWSIGEERTAWREHYFLKRPDGEQLLGSLRLRVRFHVADPRSPELMRDDPPHDVVICRGLLAMAEQPARRSLIGAIARRLAPDGLLVLGSNDRGPSGGQFRRLGPDEAQAFVRETGQSAGRTRDDLADSKAAIDACGAELRQLVVRGLMRLQQSDHAGADALFRKAITMDPSSRSAIEMLAREATRPQQRRS
ncbi:MAG: methyltransferase domain-containing protein [Planctomycetes bacterium]|nr:methyltransferase domain-containing protein [Planctomycetota bacterium]